MGIDYTDSINKILLNNKHDTIIDNEQIKKNITKSGWLSFDEYEMKKFVFTDSDGITINDTLMGFSISGGFVIFSKNEFLITNGRANPKFNKFNIEKLKDLKIREDGTWSESVFLNGKRVGSFNVNSIDKWNDIVSYIIPYFDDYINESENDNKELLIKKYDDFIKKHDIKEEDPHIRHFWNFENLKDDDKIVKKVIASTNEFLNTLSYVNKQDDFLYSKAERIYKRIWRFSKKAPAQNAIELYNEGRIPEIGEYFQFKLVYCFFGSLSQEGHGNLSSFNIQFNGNVSNDRFAVTYFYFPFISSFDEIPKNLYMSSDVKRQAVFLSFKEFINKIMTNHLITDNVEVDKLLPIVNFITKLKSDIKKEMTESNSEISKEMKLLDKDDNGIIDIIESDDFKKLLSKHESQIKDIDKSHIHKFVKLSNYLKKRRENIQSIFSALLTEDETLTKIELFGVLKNQIHNYEVLTVHSINMIISLVEGKDIIFYEIYESFDKLNVFNSNWENELSEKLTDIETNLTRGLKEIMYSIQEMEISIGNGLKHLSYVTEDSFKNLELSVTEELKSVNSSIKFNNLLTGIQTYQMYKINKNTKSLK